MDMMYAGFGDQVKEMVDGDVAHQTNLDDQQAKRDARKAEKARLEEARQKALAEADHELVARPLEASTSEYGPGSNQRVASKTLVSKQDKKRKEREEMTQEERDAADEKRKEHGRKSQEGRKKAKERREAQKERDENQQQLLPDLHEIDADLTQANSQYKEMMLYPHTENDARELATQIGVLEETRVKKLKELELNSVAAGSGSAESVVEAGWWVPENFFLPADLKHAEVGTDVMHPEALPGLRDAVRIGQQQIRDLKAKGQGDSREAVAIQKSLVAFRDELRRRKEAGKQYKLDKAKQEKEERLTVARQRAIDDPFRAEDFLSLTDLKGWWEVSGKYLARQKLNKNTTAVPGRIWTPDEPEDVLPAQVETEEM